MVKKTDTVVSTLKQHADPIIRWKLMKELFNNEPISPEFQLNRKEISSSTVVQQLLKGRNEDGQLPYHAYDKWFGAHWVLYLLADLGYPAGDENLKPLLEQSYRWLLSKEHWDNIRTIDGRVRRCASQEGNCIYYSLALGIADDRTEELATRIMRWQWADGGWNCDKRPEAINSSFHESLIPLRGMALYAKMSGDPKAQLTVEKCAEVFLKRRLFKQLSDNQVMDRNFVLLHYPSYWHYDILFGLKVMGEAGYIDDPRCSEALDLLESKQLGDGGFPAEARYYRVDDKKLTGHSRVDWGGTSKVHLNPFVTLDALSVLQRAGRVMIYCPI